MHLLFMFKMYEYTEIGVHCKDEGDTLKYLVFFLYFYFVTKIKFFRDFEPAIFLYTGCFTT